MEIFVNERKMVVDNGTTLFELKSKIKPDADVVIINGFQTDADINLQEGDRVSLIKKDEIPDESELRYLMMARHTPGVYEKLQKASIAIAGLGGLGSNIAINLARMGVGTIKLIDFDVVEPSNLNRQQYFIYQIGEQKTKALKDTLLNINPYNTYITENLYITAENVKETLQGYDVIIEAFDKAENKAMLINECVKHFPDKCIIGASGVAGVFDTESLKINKIGENIYIVGDMVNDARPGCGLMATRVAVAANIQANLAVRYLLGEI